MSLGWSIFELLKHIHGPTESVESLDEVKQKHPHRVPMLLFILRSIILMLKMPSDIAPRGM
jgi:hypothetical protein